MICKIIYYNVGVNVIDYCKWRGDIKLSYDSFNYVDNLLISYMSYVPLDDAFKVKDIYTIKELNDFFNEKEEKDLMDAESFVASAPNALTAMANTLRFKNAKVYNYESILHEDSSEQFAAFMMDLDDKTTVVCFRGTDDTIIGWHEDLMISYTTTKSQIDAAQYLNKHDKLFKKYRVIGHSKGGNLALYAAVNCKQKVRNKIIQVISNDGPGLRPNTYDKEAYKQISDRYTKIMPELSVFGIIFDDCENKIIVKSSNTGIMEHSSASWLCISNKFETVNELSRTSQLLKDNLDKFMANTNSEEREKLVKEIYASFKEANIANITDFAHGGIPVLLKAFKSASQIFDGEARETLIKLIKVFTDAVAEDLSKTVSSKAEKVKKDATIFVNDTIKNVEGIINNKNKK